MHIADLTPTQLASYSRIWGSFTAFDWTFLGRRRVLGFYGRLRVDESGSVDLRDICVACSRVTRGSEAQPGVDELRERASASRPASSGLREARSIDVCGGQTKEGAATTHIVLRYGQCEDLLAGHLEQCEPKETEDPTVLRNEYYPVSTQARPSAAQGVSTQKLSSLLSSRKAVAITGAGISTGSGIPSFRGPEGLERYFPLHEPFPGEIAEWMFEEPDKLARLLGEFQAAFIRAEPNAAHVALAELENVGVVRHVVTGNGDKLHERAGSRNVHLKDAAQFGQDGEGWEWLRSGSVLLAIGLGRDEHGLISYCRDTGMAVVAVSPERPEFLHETDLYVEGRAEEVLPLVVSTE